MSDNPRRLNLPHVLAMGVLLLACVGLEYSLHIVRGVTIVYTHLFYIPILVAAVWWGLKGGLPVSLFLGSMHTICDLPGISESVLARTLALVCVGSVIGVISDKRKRAEEKAKELSEDSKRRAVELQAANIKLQELDRLKSMFIASMSHELRTPLNSIIGFTGIMLQGVAGEITEEQRKQLTMVKNSANHLLALINDVIDVSKIEAGKIELHIEEFNLSNIAQEIKDSFKVAATEKGLKMSLKMPKRLTIESDERRTKQVIMNFVSNALKFTDEGRIEMKVEKRDGKAEASVRDTGTGIKKEHMDMLFKPFSQIPIEGRPKREGTGLGLYLSKKIADLLGGEIKAESEFEKGSVFTFTLPLEYKEVKK